MAAKHQDLLQEITIMMTDPNQAQNEKKIDDIMKKIRKLKADKTPDQLRLAACHFMTMYHTRKAMSLGMSSSGNPANPMQDPSMQMMSMDPMSGLRPPNGMSEFGNDSSLLTSGDGDSSKTLNYEAIEIFKASQRKDMELGWDLLNIKSNTSQAAKTARVLKIEVAQRLEDSNKLKEAFDDLIKRDLSDEEVMVAFTAAPFLGEWSHMMRLGKEIEKTPYGLEQLHMMSMQLPIPDFTLVYELAKQYKLDKNKNTPSIDELKWTLIQVEKIRVKFSNVDCGEFEEKRKELLDEIKKQEVEWEEVPNCSHVHIKRMGALCQAVSFGEIPMMLNGPWLENRIHVKGRTEMPMMSEEQQMAAMGGQFGGMGMPNPDDMTVLVQEEEWILEQSKDDSNLYTGKYTLKQRPELGDKTKITPEHAPVNMEFECEITLKKSNDDDQNNDNKNKKKAITDEYEDEKIDNEEDDNVEPLVTEFDGLELD